METLTGIWNVICSICVWCWCLGVSLIANGNIFGWIVVIFVGVIVLAGALKVIHMLLKLFGKSLYYIFCWGFALWFIYLVWTVL